MILVEPHPPQPKETQMDKIVVYSTGCPNCRYVEKSLDNLNLKYEVITDTDKMVALGMMSAPGLQINDGPIMNITQIRKWLKEQYSNG